MDSINDSSAFVTQLLAEIQSFESTLDPLHEAKICTVSAGGRIIYSNRLSYRHPDLICFYGVDPSGLCAVSLCHISQVNFSLIAYLVARPEEKQKIGFIFSDSE